MRHLVSEGKPQPDVQSVLVAYPDDCQPRRLESLGGAGGFSGAEIWKVHAPAGLLCLRCWPRESPSEDELLFIHGVLRHVARAGVTIVPVPRLTIGGKSYIRHDDRFWELAPWMPGKADFHLQPTPIRLAAALRALAEFHLAAATFPWPAPHLGRSPAIQERLRLTRQWILGGLDDVRSRLDAKRLPITAEVAKEILSLAPATLPSVLKSLELISRNQVALQPCIRDIWHDHVLFEEDRVTGLIDFGSMRLENPAADIARLLGSLAGDDPLHWETGLTAYTTLRPLSPGERNLVDVFDRSTVVLSGLNWIDWVYCQGRVFPDWKTVAIRMGGILARLRVLAARIIQLDQVD